MFGVTEAGLALKNTVMSRENMFYFVNCLVTESNLANKTVFPTPVFIKETHTAMEAARQKFIAFRQVGRHKTKNKVPIIFVVNCKGKTNTHEHFTLVGQKHFVRQKEENRI